LCRRFWEDRLREKEYEVELEIWKKYFSDKAEGGTFNTEIMIDP
jgi:hypothetical protein